MLACDVRTLYPREWDRARKKYKRDLDDLIDLFEAGEEEELNGGKGEKAGHMKKVRFFPFEPMFTGVKRTKKSVQKGVSISVFALLTR